MKVNQRLHRETALTVFTLLSSVVVPRFQSSGMQFTHVSGAFCAEWIASQPLPRDRGERGPDQAVTLVDNTNFHREVDESAVAQQYQTRPRTRVMENIDTQSDGWYALVTLHLTRLMCRRVVCSLYESRPHDSTLGPHDDEWDGVIVQVRGAKSWRLWPEICGKPVELVTETGDVLLIPRGLTHEVATPDYSAHLMFAVTDRSFAQSA